MPTSAPPFTIPPPVLDDDWEITSSGAATQAHSLDTCPAGSDGMEFQRRLDSSGPFASDTPGACTGVVTVGGICTIGLSYELRARWTLGGVPVSDWGNAGPVVCAF